MSRIKQILCVSAVLGTACFAVAAGSLSASAATKEDVIAAARAAGFPEVYVQAGINKLNEEEYTSEDYDSFIAALHTYEDEIWEKINQQFGTVTTAPESGDSSTTVTTTMIIAHMAGISVFATGGIGGVHRGAQQTFDISADLEELAHTPVMVVCAGAKSILDLGLTLEYLETHGVPVIGYGTRELPAFYTRKSGFAVDYEIDTPEELARAFYVKQDMGLGGGMLVTNPIPEEFSMDADVINKAIDEAVEEANAQGIHGKETTPFLLAKIKDLTGGDSLASNIQLVYNNAKLAAATAVELSKLAKN